MPIFEYKCSQCGRINEFLESHGSKDAHVCAYCGSKNMEKQFSTFSPRIKEGASKKCHGCSDGACPHSGH